jgi:predicted RNA-binding Zn ribbon-like protein
VVTDTRSPETPHALDLVIDFVNTLDIDADTDALSSADALTAWLAQAQVLSPATAAPTALELRQAIDVREALRALMLANNGADGDARAVRELELAARRGELGVHFGEGGGVTLAPSAEGFAGAIARLLVPVAEAASDGSWQRVKACRAENCQWAFYDRSRNRSGVWCEMAVCGNRTKVRAYRQRGTREQS